MSRRFPPFGRNRGSASLSSRLG